MLPLIEMIIANVNEESPLIIIKAIEIQFWVCEFHFFKTLGKIKRN